MNGIAMSDRTDLPKIKPDTAPTIFNHEAGKWGWISGFIGVLVAIPTVIVPKARIAIKTGRSAELVHSELNEAGAIIIAAQLAGAAIGGTIEKHKQEREQTEGRIVKTPGYWNKGILSGFLVSSLIQTPIAMSKKPLSNGLSAVIGLGSAVIGSVMRKDQLQRDFDKSVALRNHEQAQLQALLRHEAPLPEPTYKNSVTPEESATLHQQQTAPKTHADKLVTARDTAEPATAMSA